MEFRAKEDKLSNIYTTLSGDHTTTFTKEELSLNNVFNDVNDELFKLYENDREEQKSEIRKHFTHDNYKTSGHPSKEFVLLGGLKSVLNEIQREKAIREKQKKQNNIGIFG